MTKFQSKITTAFATGAVLLNALAPLTFAQTSLVISGNGTDSASTATVSTTNTTTVVQDNNANINNTVNVNSDTGNNSASDNTGGNVEIETGDATTDVTVTNMVNNNSATVDACCDSGDTEVLISGNGSDSANDVVLNRNNTVTLSQENDAHVNNHVDVDADTGDNDADDNTGGDVEITTGDVDTTIKLSTVANANSATIGGGNGNGGTLSAWITGNGTDSDNDIDLDLANYVTLVQDNNANVDNHVDVDGDTGNNDADDNTGGEVYITTGDADATVEVDNMVNFNGADVDACGCLGDLEAKISGNGSDSDSTIGFDADNTLTAFQTNQADLDNDVDVDGDTGDNDADDNTGEVDADSDPSVTTGDTDTTVELQNAGNSNSFGQDFSDLLEELDFDFEFDFSGLLSLFMGHTS